MQLNSSNGNLDGTVQEVTVEGAAPNLQLNSSSISVLGSSIGTTISVSFDAGNEVFGTVSGDSFTLNIPQSDGSLAPVEFDSASTDSYNQAVANLQSEIQQTNEATATSQAQAAQAAAATEQAEVQRATPVCQAVGGVLSTDGGFTCENIAYLGNDGATYYSSVSMNSSTGSLDGPMATGEFGATEQECASSYYPNLSTGSGYGPKGTWNGVLSVCLPAPQ